MREPKIGDRFTPGDNKWTYEVIDDIQTDYGYCRAKCIIIESIYTFPQVGSIQEGYLILTTDVYLGNFNKSNNYNNLYNLLNGIN